MNGKAEVFKSFPKTHFPSLYTPHINKRELFAGWGNVWGVDFSEARDGLKTVPQKVHYSHSWDYISARTASLPILPHNKYPNDRPEPCMSHITKQRQSLLATCVQLQNMKGKLKLDRNNLKKVEKALRRLERKYGMLPPDDDLDTDNVTAGSDQDGSGNEDATATDEDANVIDMAALSKACRKNDLAKMIEESEGLFEVDCQSLEVNNKYSGGAVCTLQDRDSTITRGHIFTMRGENMNELYVQPYSVEDHTLHTEAEGTSTLRLDSQIYQVTAAQPQGQAFIVVREDSRCSVITNNQPTEESSAFNVVISHRWEEGRPTFINPSPYIPGEVLVCAEKQSQRQGEVYLWDTNSGSAPHSIVSSISPRSASHGDWWQCYYGNHPRQVTVTDHTGIGLWDVRARGTACHHDLFSVPHKALHPWERVVASTPHPADRHYYLTATDYSVIMLDDRFPNHTVLLWSHPLISIPQYLQVLPQVTMTTDSGRNDLLLVGSQGIPEVFAQPISMQYGTPHPPSFSGAPWRISKSIDFAELVKRVEPATFDLTAARRLEAPLVGVSGVSHGDGGFSVIQLSSMGDLFCQDYRRTTSHPPGDKTHTPRPGSVDILLHDDDLSKARDWLKAAANHDAVNTVEFDVADKSKFYDESRQHQFICNILCPLCGSKFSHQRAASVHTDDVNDTDATSKCYSCTYQTTYTEELRTAALEGAPVMPSPDPPAPLPDLLTSHTLEVADDDLTTQIVLGLWRREDTTQLSKTRDEKRTKELQDEFEKWKLKTVGMPDEAENDDVAPSDGEQREDLRVPKNEPMQDQNLSAEPTQLADASQNVKVEPAFTHPSSSFFTPPRPVFSLDTIRTDDQAHTTTPTKANRSTPSRYRHLSTSSVDSTRSNASKHSMIGFAVTPTRIRDTTKTESPTSDWLGRSLNRLMSPPDEPTPPRKKKRRKDVMGF